MKTFIVSGGPRQGTSAAMQCLAAGKPELEVCRDSTQDKQLADICTAGGYRPNPRGYYELPQGTYREVHWYTKVGGKLAKVLYRHIGRLGALPDNHYHVLWMWRDYESTSRSWEKAYQTPMPLSIEDWLAVQHRQLSILWMRRDCTVVEVDYNTLIDSPQKVVKQLNDYGWEIGLPYSFEAEIDPFLRRNHVEAV